MPSSPISAWRAVLGRLRAFRALPRMRISTVPRTAKLIFRASSERMPCVSVLSVRKTSRGPFFPSGHDSSSERMLCCLL